VDAAVANVFQIAHHWRRATDVQCLPIWSVSWMDTSAVKTGYLVQQSRAFNGWLIYDTERGLVYYNFWD
jgi:hypothetical protein